MISFKSLITVSDEDVVQPTLSEYVSAFSSIFLVLSLFLIRILLPLFFWIGGWPGFPFFGNGLFLGFPGALPLGRFFGLCWGLDLGGDGLVLGGGDGLVLGGGGGGGLLGEGPGGGGGGGASAMLSLAIGEDAWF